jgi:hypothetical protein
MAYKITQRAGDFRVVDGIAGYEGYGSVVNPAIGSIKAEHFAVGPFVQTTLTLTGVGQSIVNGTEHQGTQIYDFPQGRVYFLGAIATFQQTTTSTLASTLNASSVGAIGVGTATSSATTLAGTMQDIIPTTAFTSSATINVPGTAVSGVLASPAVFDGTGTAKDLFLNTAFATTTDVDGNATQTISGKVVITWLNLGDLPLTF